MAVVVMVMDVSYTGGTDGESNPCIFGIGIIIIIIIIIITITNAHTDSFRAMWWSASMAQADLSTTKCAPIPLSDIVRIPNGRNNIWYEQTHPSS